MKRLDAIIDRAIDYMAYGSGAIIVFIMLAMSMEVVGRTVFRYSSVWAVPFTEYSMLYMTFLGTTWLLRKESHPAFDLVTNMLDDRSRARMNGITSIAGAAICFVVTVMSAWTTVNLIRSGTTDPSIIEVPKWILVIIIPIGSMMLFIQFCRRAHRFFRAGRAAKTNILETPSI